ncbi:MAG: nucleoside recognition domain-containing protein [Breznakibacter sp.]
MALNYVWIAFFFIAFVVALVKLIFFGNVDVFSQIMGATFDSAKTGFEISLGLTGVLSLWMGIMKIGEQGGMVNVLSRIMGPLFSKLFPDLPKNHPAYGSIMMNLAANMLGLDNAATPMGLKAMTEMQHTNPQKDMASNPMIMFLVLNTSGLTIVPVSIMVYRAQLGAANPSDVFLPILLATFFSTMVGLIAVAVMQRINLFDKTILAWLGGMMLGVCGLIYWLQSLPQDEMNAVSLLVSNVLLFSIIIGFILMGVRKRINVYDAFVEGAKEGFTIAVKIIPFLIAMLVAIAVFRASGAMDFLEDGIRVIVAGLGFNTDFVEALPTALMKPLSGSGARTLMVDSMKAHGADSFVGRLSCMFQGASDTTFYILAVYFGSVGIKRTRYALSCGLLADLAGVVAAIFLGYLFFA